MSRFAIRDFKAGDPSVCCLCTSPIDLLKKGVLGVDRLLATIADKNEPVCESCLLIEDKEFHHRYSEISVQDNAREVDYIAGIRSERLRVLAAVKSEKQEANKSAKAVAAEWSEEAARFVAIHPKRLKLKHQLVRHQQELLPLLDAEELAAAKVVGHLAPIEALRIEAKVQVAVKKWNSAGLDVGILSRAAPKNPMIFHGDKEKEAFDERVKSHAARLAEAEEVFRLAAEEKDAAVQEDAALRKERAGADAKQIDIWLAELSQAQQQTSDKQKLIRTTQEQLASLEERLLRELTTTKETVNEQPIRS